jgi:phosphohistidine phosphatase
MKLHLVRHATASDAGPSDALRELTREGREEARIAGAALAELDVRISYVLSSPLVRARQTAEIVSEALKLNKDDVELLPELANNASTTTLLKALRPYALAGEIILVGHMPSLAEHLAVLIGVANGRGFALGKAGVACVELQRLRAGAGQLRWLMSQKQLQQISDR